MRSQQAFLSFSSGVMSPRLTLRADSEKYAHALQTGDNWFITPQGGITFRNGTEYIGVNVTPADETRIFTHVNGGDKSDFLVMAGLSDGEVWKDDVKIAPAFSFQYLTAAELEDIQHTNKEDLSVFAHPEYPPDYLNISEAEAFDKNILEQIKVPMLRYDDEKSPGDDAGISASYALTFVNGTADSWVEGTRYFLGYGNQTASTGFPEPLPLRIYYSVTTATNEARILAALRSMFYLNDPLTHTITVTYNAGTTYDIVITGGYAGKDIWVLPEQPDTDIIYTVVQTGDVELGEEPAWSYPYVVTHGGSPNYYQAKIPHKSLLARDEPGVGSSWTDYWTDLGTSAPAWWAWQHASVNAWVNLTIYGPWDRGFPTVAVFREQRLLLMGNKDMPTGMWGSRIGVYDDFIGGVEANDPFFFALDSDDSPRIQWATSTQIGLIVGTSSGDWLVSAETTLGPTDINARKQNNARSMKAKSVTIDNEMFYIERGKEKLRMSRYVRDSLGFSSVDVSIIAEHLCQPGMKRVVVMHTPEVMIFCLRDDGTLATLSYNKEQQVAAWSPMNTEQGTIFDLAVVHSTVTNTDDLYMMILRGTDYYLEKMPYPERTFDMIADPDDHLSLQGVVCMDSWIAGAFSPGPPTIPTEITGLDHLDGLTVGVLLDDAYGGTHVITAGTLTLGVLETAPTSYAVGILYTGDGKTFEPSMGNPNGVTFGTARRWNKLYLRLLDSALPLINGQLPADRRPSTPQLSVDGVRGGLRDVQVGNLGFDDNGEVTIVQDKPYPTHVLGMFGEFGVNNS